MNREVYSECGQQPLNDQDELGEATDKCFGILEHSVCDDMLFMV